MSSSGYAGMDADRRIPAADLRSFVYDLFRACGLSDADADLVTEANWTTDLRGMYSHGCAMVPGFVDRLVRGQINPRGRPRVVKDGGAALVVDGDGAMGQVATAFGMQQAIDRARQTGIAAVAIGGSNHCGAMAYYPMMALAADMIGFATTNALPVMAPWGGIDRLLGINPIGVAMPAGSEIPIVLDTSFGVTAFGKIVVHNKKGERIPEGWAFDAEGYPTTDPAAALAGLVQPIGAYKGTGMALITGLLGALLSGAAYGPELGSIASGPLPGRDGQFVTALNVAAFEDIGVFKERMDGILRQYRASRKAPGFDRVYTPGELEVETEQRYRVEGVPVNEVTLQELAGAGARVGVGAGWLPAPR